MNAMASRPGGFDRARDPIRRRHSPLFEGVCIPCPIPPGAIIASLTIGTGELIFSTRGGSLFGYRVRYLFVLISFLKWGLVLATLRHMVLTGVHPYK